jgi:hypothetical protein
MKVQAFLIHIRVNGIGFRSLEAGQYDPCPTEEEGRTDLETCFGYVSPVMGSPASWFLTASLFPG